ncbi:MAG: hypothetical protein ABI047_01140 [Jatrophihabitantaceae bacterium]
MLSGIENHDLQQSARAIGADDQLSVAALPNSAKLHADRVKHVLVSNPVLLGCLSDLDIHVKLYLVNQN